MFKLLKSALGHENFIPTSLVLKAWLWCSLLCAFSSHGHLLNMSKVQISVQQDGTVLADFNLDLSRELGSSDDYYSLSQLSQPMTQPRIVTVLSHLSSATQLMVDNAPISWQINTVELPHNPMEDFYSGVVWPMTHIQLKAQLPLDKLNSGFLLARFSGEFVFEEPIALTFLQVHSGRKMSRWLVPNQQSPLFALNAQTETLTSVGLPWQQWFDYVYLGMKHIMPMGWDHVLFVLGLFLGMRSVGQLLWLISGFTVAHSVTLALSSYGAIQLSPAIVEPLIAFSIIWVAIENILFRRPGGWRILTVFMFGLLHGLGFAESLRDLGLPTDSFIGSLISFNIGLELAQIAVVLLAFILVGRLRATAIWRSRVVIPASSVISLVAFYWTLTRIWY